MPQIINLYQVFNLYHILCQNDGIFTKIFELYQVFTHTDLCQNVPNIMYFLCILLCKNDLKI